MRIKKNRNWMRRTLLAVALLLLATVVAAVVQEERARRTALAEFPPPGTMVSLETHRLHLHCLGEGSPTVVFEADLDNYGSLSWALVHERVSTETRACVYDRAGFIWSEPGPGPRDAAQIAGELRDLLERAGEHAPFLLVGHGVGGAYTRVFADRYPDAVAGVVLVESAHPEQVARLATNRSRDTSPPAWMKPIAVATSRLGLGRRRRVPKYRAVPLDVYGTLKAFSPLSGLAWFDERRCREASFAQAGAVADLGAVPLTVISVPPRSGGGRALQGLTEVESNVVRTGWLGLQEELTHLSSNSRHIVLEEDAGHYPQFDRSGEVSRAILETLSAVHGDRAQAFQGDTD